MNTELETLQKIVNELLAVNHQQERLIEETIMSVQKLIGLKNTGEKK